MLCTHNSLTHCDRPHVMHSILLVHQSQTVRSCSSRDVMSFCHFSVTLSGETLCDEKMPIILERMDFPDPVIKIAIEPKSKVCTLCHHVHYHTKPLHPAHIACETGPSACISGSHCTPMKYGADHITPLQRTVTAMVSCGRHYTASE